MQGTSPFPVPTVEQSSRRPNYTYPSSSFWHILWATGAEDVIAPRDLSPPQGRIRSSVSLRAKLTRYGDDKDSSSNGEELRMGLEAGVCVLKCSEDRPCVCVWWREREREKDKENRWLSAPPGMQAYFAQVLHLALEREGNTSVCWLSLQRSPLSCACVLQTKEHAHTTHSLTRLHDDCARSVNDLPGFPHWMHELTCRADCSLGSRDPASPSARGRSPHVWSVHALHQVCSTLNCSRYNIFSVHLHNFQEINSQIWNLWGRLTNEFTTNVTSCLALDIRLLDNGRGSLLLTR